MYCESKFKNMSQNVADDIPETGAVFTFGKSRFADNEPSHFFIKNDPVVSISCGDEHSAVICQQGRVFVFGANSYGQLGLGHTDEVSRPSCVKWLKPQKAIFVACGRAHTIFITDTYAIYTVGCNDEGQLGTGNTENQCVPQYVDLECDDVRIKQVSAGSSHTVILTEGGRVFVCGSNSEGQLGLGEEVKMATTLHEVKFAETITLIECGYYQTVFITDKGTVFITGDNEGQKLGIVGIQKIYLPTALPIDAPIKNACCGASHTFFLSQCETKVLALGSNEQGQLGLPKAVVDVRIPTELPIDKMFDGHQLKLVSCGAFHTAFVTDNGHLYTCGEARHNKLCLDKLDSMPGVDESMPNQYTPKRVITMASYIVDNVACGGCHTIMTAIKTNHETDKEKPAVPSELPPLQKVLSNIEMNVKENNVNNTVEALNEGLDESVQKNVNSFENIGDSIKGEVQNITTGMGESLEGGLKTIKNEISDSAAEMKEKIENIGTEINENLGDACDKMKDTVQSIEESAQSGFKTASDGLSSLKDSLKEKTNEVSEKVLSNGESSTDNVKEALHLPEILKDAKNSPPPKHPPGNLLLVPDRSPDGSQNEGNTDNETIYCESDKSSPQDTKTRMQAVMPIVRAEDGLPAVAPADESEVVTQNVTKKGPFSRFMQSLRDKETSCMRKGKVIENTVTETVNKGITTAEETVNKVEETIVHEIHNQKNSKTCVIL